MKWIAVVLAVAACTPVTYGPVKRVMIEGRPVTVMQVTNREGAWYAMNKTGLVSQSDPAAYRRNIKAIEAVTGCRADLGTVVNMHGQTTVAVVCN